MEPRTVTHVKIFYSSILVEEYFQCLQLSLIKVEKKEKGYDDDL